MISTMKKLLDRLFGVKTITDTFKPSDSRSERQIRRDAYMRLQNKIISSDMLHVEHLGDGQVKVSLKCKK